MEGLSFAFGMLSFALLFAFVGFFVLLIVRLCMKKFDLWIVITTAACLVGFILFFLIGVSIDPVDSCEHNWGIVSETEKSVIEECSLCGEVNVTNKTTGATEIIAPTTTTPPACEHQYDVTEEVAPTCTEGGKTVKICALCNDEVIEQTDSIGHSMKEISRVEPTYAEEGSVVSKCERCDFEETEPLAKLDPIVVEFDGLELTFGQYSFTKVKNKFSSHNGADVVKIPVTVKNISSSPNSLNYFDYSLYGSAGVSSDRIDHYFDDDVYNAGNLLADKSYTAYFHILYDGDGVYTIVFDDFFFEEVTVEVVVKK